jgi:hypothetical protein
MTIDSSLEISLPQRALGAAQIQNDADLEVAGRNDNDDDEADEVFWTDLPPHNRRAEWGAASVSYQNPQGNTVPSSSTSSSTTIVASTTDLYIQDAFLFQAYTQVPPVTLTNHDPDPSDSDSSLDSSTDQGGYPDYDDPDDDPSKHRTFVFRSYSQQQTGKRKKRPWKPQFSSTGQRTISFIEDYATNNGIPPAPPEPPNIRMYGVPNYWLKKQHMKTIRNIQVEGFVESAYARRSLTYESDYDCSGADTNVLGKE